MGLTVEHAPAPDNAPADVYSLFSRRRPEPKAEERVQRTLDDIEQGLFFIVGTGRCGSTLLQAMLGAHSRLGIPPETKFFQEWDPALAAGDPLPSEEAVDQHIDRARSMWFWEDLQLDEQRLRAATIAGGRSGKAMFLETLAQWRERLGKPRIGEKTPGHLKRLERILALFPRAKAIHIYRDPRDVVASIARLRWGGHSSALRHARTWAKAMRRHLRYARELPPEQYHSVQFERLVREPEATLREVCGFLGEAFEPGMLRYHEAESARKAFDPRETQWKASATRPIDTSAVGKGLTQLTPRQVRTVERVAGDLLARLGYTRAPGLRDRLAWRALDGLESLSWSARRMGRSVAKRLGAPAPARRVSPARRQRAQDVAAAPANPKERVERCPT